LPTAYVDVALGCWTAAVSPDPDPDATPVTAMLRTPIDANDASR
jgi:hypothetical protein